MFSQIKASSALRESEQSDRDLKKGHRCSSVQVAHWGLTDWTLDLGNRWNICVWFQLQVYSLDPTARFVKHNCSDGSMMKGWVQKQTEQSGCLRGRYATWTPSSLLISPFLLCAFLLCLYSSILPPIQPPSIHLASLSLWPWDATASCVKDDDRRAGEIKQQL